MKRSSWIIFYFSLRMGISFVWFCVLTATLAEMCNACKSEIFLTRFRAISCLFVDDIFTTLWYQSQDLFAPWKIQVSLLKRVLCIALVICSQSMLCSKMFTLKIFEFSILCWILFPFFFWNLMQIILFVWRFSEQMTENRRLLINSPPLDSPNYWTHEFNVNQVLGLSWFLWKYFLV